MTDDRPQFLLTLHLRPPGTVDSLTEAEAQLAGAHFEYAKSLLERGHLIYAGRTQDAEPVGLIALRAADEREARALAEADPGIKGGLFTWDLRPYTVALIAQS